MSWTSFLLHKRNYSFPSTFSQYEKCNRTNVSEIVGICTKHNCNALGNLQKVCPRCMKNGQYSTFEHFENQCTIKPFVPFYVGGTAIRRMVPLRDTDGILVSRTPPSSDFEECSITSAISFYTPGHNGVENDEDMYWNPETAGTTSEDILQESLNRSLELEVMNDDDPPPVNFILPRPYINSSK